MIKRALVLLSLAGLYIAYQRAKQSPDVPLAGEDAAAAPQPATT